MKISSQTFIRAYLARFFLFFSCSCLSSSSFWFSSSSLLLDYFYFFYLKYSYLSFLTFSGRFDTNSGSSIQKYHVFYFLFRILQKFSNLVFIKISNYFLLSLVSCYKANYNQIFSLGVLNSILKLFNFLIFSSFFLTKKSIL